MATSGKIGRYEILEELGHGAMGTVYRAKDPSMDRVVAVKTISSVVLGTEHGTQFRDRFYREARAAGALAHPGIVPIFDVGEHEGVPFLVMEFVNGRTLADSLKKGERLGLDRACEIGQKIAEALGYAHQHGVVHRDIKPANILLTSRETYGIERPKIADFGVAKLAEGRTTLTGQLVGTPAFMPPEQFLGGPIDGRADIFSLGVVLYWMVTGEQPFPGESITSVSYKVVHTEAVPPRKLNPWVSAGLDQVIMKCLAKSPEDRFQTGEELARELGRIRDDAKAAAVRQSAPSAGASAAAIAPALQKEQPRSDPDATIDSSLVRPAPPIPAQPATAPPAPVAIQAQAAKRPVAGKSSTRLALVAVLGVIVVAGGWYVVRTRQRSELQKEAQKNQAQIAPETNPSPATVNASQPPSPASPAAPDQGTGNASAVSPSGPGASQTSTDQKGSAASPSAQAGSEGAAPKEAQPAPMKPAASSVTTKKSSPKTVARANPPAPPKVAAPAPTPAPAPAVVAFDPKGLDPKQNARLKIDTSRVPAGIDFTIEMNGQVYYHTRSAGSEASEEGLFVPPGIWDFRVTAHGGALQKASNTVSAEFKAKKKLTLRIELRDKAASQANAVPQGIYQDTQILLSLK